VHPGLETLMYYFLCIRGTGTDLTKTTLGHVTLNLFFFSSGEICGSCSAFRCVPMQNIDVVLFMLGWPLCGFHKKCVRTRYAKLEFLHLVGSAGHVV
jgi:hypothetical protein